MRVITAILVVALCGCIGYETKLGPRFTPASAPPGRSIIYLYRPAKLTGWMRPVHVVIAGHERIVMVEGYAVLSAAPGHYDAVAYSTGTAQNFITIGFGGAQWKGATGFDVEAGKPVYLRLGAAFGSTAISVVSEAEGSAAIAGLHLTPGGALRE